MWPDGEHLFLIHLAFSFVSPDTMSAICHVNCAVLFYSESVSGPVTSGSPECLRIKLMRIRSPNDEKVFKYHGKRYCTVIAIKNKFWDCDTVIVLRRYLRHT